MSPPLLQNDSSTSQNGIILPFISTYLPRIRRAPRYILLLICSPILLPFLCLSFPLICFAELCFRVCRRRRRSQQVDDRYQDRIRQREDVEEGGEEVGLMQRYLEDQLSLVRSVYECGGDEDGDCGIRDFDFFVHGQRPLLSHC